MTLAWKLRGFTLLAVAAAAALAGCGAKESNHLKAAPTETKPGVQLRGTYTTTLTKSDLPKKLVGAAPKWTLIIAPTGGPPSKSTPIIRLSNAKTGVLTKSRLGVETDTLLMHDEFCGATHGSVDSLYHYKVDAKQLRISKFKTGCPDRINESVLTAKPWTKQRPGG